MASTFLGLNTSKSGLNYYQAALNTTAHNVSNAETEGYSRQQVISKASNALRLGNSAGMQGTGVKITGIERVRNPYFDTKYWNGNSLGGEYGSKYDYSYEIETYFNEMNSATGYTSLLTNLQNSMKTLADDPSSATTRVQYVNDFQSYTELFHEIANNLQNTQKSLNDELVVRVDEINSISKELFTLNDQINNIELRNGNANDLRDQRTLLIDKLSELVNTSTEEIPILAEDGHDSGATRYIVRINGEVLVDDLQCRQLMAVPRDEKVNETDINGLYELAWRNTDGTAGDEFNINSPTLTGKLAGIIAVRDGNNNHGFVGKTTGAGIDATGTGYVTMTTDKAFYLNDLNVAASGKIRIHDTDYYYDSFEAQYDNATGEITGYTFQNLKVLSADGKSQVGADTTKIKAGLTARVGNNVNFEGVPYYMSKLNEFVRTFSRHMNDICTSGVDADGEQGLDMLNTLDVDGKNLDLSATTGDTSFTSKGVSYYRLTALNWSVNETVMKDPNKVVVSDKAAIDQGDVEKCNLLKEIQDSLTNTSIFKQGSPSQYLESIISTLGVQTKRCKISMQHQNNIVYSINQQRMSESSVDSNEEASNLIIQQNGYNLACKVMSVLDEIYDKLINGTGV